jgi:hypothetical protein
MLSAKENDMKFSDEIESFCSFMTIPDLYNNFFHDKKIIVNSLAKEINLDDFYDFEKKYIEFLRNSNRKDFMKVITESGSGKNQLDSLYTQIKFMIIRIRFLLGNKIYSNVDRVLYFNQVRFF